MLMPPPPFEITPASEPRKARLIGEDDHRGAVVVVTFVGDRKIAA
jgi:hypothetical protein